MNIIKLTLAILAILVLTGCDSSSKATDPNLHGVKVYGKDNSPRVGNFVRNLLGFGAAPAAKLEEADLVVSYEDISLKANESYFMVVVRSGAGSVLDTVYAHGLAPDMEDEAREFALAYEESRKKDISPPK